MINYVNSINILVNFIKIKIILMQGQKDMCYTVVILLYFDTITYVAIDFINFVVVSIILFFCVTIA